MEYTFPEWGSICMLPNLYFSSCLYCRVFLFYTKQLKLGVSKHQCPVMVFFSFFLFIQNAKPKIQIHSRGFGSDLFWNFYLSFWLSSGL